MHKQVARGGPALHGVAALAQIEPVPAARACGAAILDREGSNGKDVATAIGGTFYPADVTDFTGLEETLAAAVADLGGLHVIVTTAGGGTAKKTLGRSGPHDLETFRQVVDLNLIATFNINRLAAAHMANNEPEDDERGVIVNTASIAAFEGQIGQVAYTAAKAGIAGMALTMARDLGSYGIRVLAMSPLLMSSRMEFADRPRTHLSCSVESESCTPQAYAGALLTPGSALRDRSGASEALGPG